MPFVIPESCELEDEALLFMSDVLPTAYWSVENAGVKKDDTVAVIGLWADWLDGSEVRLDERRKKGHCNRQSSL